MRTTLNLDDELIANAQKCTGIKQKTLLVHLGLKALISREAAQKLAEMGGSMPDFQVPPRCRSL